MLWRWTNPNAVVTFDNSDIIQFNKWEGVVSVLREWHYVGCIKICRRSWYYSFWRFDKSLRIVKKQKYSYVNRKLEHYVHNKHVVICSNQKRIACSWTVFCVREGVSQYSEKLHADQGYRGHMTRNEKAYWMIKRDLLPVIALHTHTHTHTHTHISSTFLPHSSTSSFPSPILA